MAVSPRNRTVGRKCRQRWIYRHHQMALCQERLSPNYRQKSGVPRLVAHHRDLLDLSLDGDGPGTPGAVLTPVPYRTKRRPSP